MSEHVKTALQGKVARITIDRPPVNVLTTDMLRAIAAAVAELASHPEASVVRIDSVGKMFSAGVDVLEHEGEALGPMMDALRSLFEVLGSAPIPTVAVVQGPALGGGCELVLGTDLCLASERASFGQPEIRLGVFAPPASVLLPRIVGERRALGLLLSGETIPAAEAERIGIANRVFPAATFEEEADAWIGRLAGLSGAALRLAKRAVVLTRGLPIEEAHRATERLYLDELMRTEDAAEGLRSFVEKRPPVWKHR
jgi:cyclohexa-1,5-dienecarbonyl-CoA hydratase